MRLVVATGIVLLAAACGGGPPSDHVAQQQNGAVAFSSCMRSNGVSKFPDPNSAGDIPKVGLEQLSVTSTQFQAAQAACRHLLPNGGRPPNQAQLRRVKTLSLAFARCVRAHGVPNFPDPDSSGRIPDHGFDQGSPRFQAANNACAKYRPPYMPSNAAYDAYARTHGG
ncbi:MAG TPA: hypothetical protein VGH92_01385 [Gaiellaceae bacterium]|jgi:hypothetical protein